MRNNNSHKDYQICSCCVMDTTDSKIVFDENGVCDFCNDYKKNILSNWKPNTNNMDELMEISQIIKKNNKGRKYESL